MVTGIEHVAIASPDPLRLALWYVEHLDFVINYQPASSKTVFIKAADGSMIEIIESAPDAVPAAGMNPAGLRHLALTVVDFPEIYARLKHPPRPPPPPPHVRLFPKILPPPQTKRCAFSYRCADHQWEFPSLLYRSGRQCPPPAAPRNPLAVPRIAPRFCFKSSPKCGALATL